MGSVKKGVRFSSGPQIFALRTYGELSGGVLVGVVLPDEELPGNCGNTCTEVVFSVKYVYSEVMEK